MTGKRIGLTAIILLGALCACATAEQATKGTPPASDAIELSGVPMLVGNLPFPILQFTTPDGKKYSLAGPLLDELKNLQNVTIKVIARKTGEKDQEWDRLEVLDYDVLDVGKGVKPYLGQIELRGGVAVLVVKGSGQVLTLAGNRKALDILARANGGKAWVTGDLSGTTLTIKRFKVLSGNKTP